MHLKAGDKVRLDWRSDYEDDSMGAKTATVFDHPVCTDWVIIVSDDDNRDFAFSAIYQRNGADTWGARDVTLIDPAREVWDALHAELRAHINWLGRAPAHNAWNVDAEGAGQKIRAIKLLRAMTGLSLADAKRVVESQWP